MMEFKVYEITYKVSEITAIADCDGADESKRQNALLVVGDNGIETTEHVVFDWDMPETMDDFMEMCEDEWAWEALSEDHCVK